MKRFLLTTAAAMLIASPAFGAGLNGYNEHIADKCTEGQPCMLIPPPPPAKNDTNVIDWELVGQADPSPTHRGPITEADRWGAATPWWTAMGMDKPADNGQDWGNEGNERNSSSSDRSSTSNRGSSRDVSRSRSSSRSRSGSSATTTSAPSSAPSSSPSSGGGRNDCRR